MDLSELIRVAKGDRSYDQLARDCGDRPTAQRLQQMVTQPHKGFPDRATIESLARGLRVEPRAVVIAAAKSLGIDMGHRDSSVLCDLIGERSARLSSAQVAALVAMVDVMVSHPQATEYIPRVGTNGKAH